MKIQPIGKRVLLNKVELADKTTSGIYVPKNVSEDTIGIVQAIGKEVTTVSLGQKVVYSKYGATEVKDSNISYIILEEKDILAIIEEA